MSGPLVEYVYCIIHDIFIQLEGVGFMAKVVTLNNLNLWAILL